MMFRDQVGILTDWFKGWNECEQTVALLSLLKRVSRTQARFLHICLEHWLADCTEIHILEAEANNAATVSQWHQEPKEKVVSLLLSHLPLLQPRNCEAKCEYMKLLQKVLTHTIESSLFVEESRQLLSYALIHPATTLDDRTSLASWLNHLEEHLSSGYASRAPPSPYHPRQSSDEWPGSAEALDPGNAWPDKSPSSSTSPAGQNGHMPFPGGLSSPISGNGNNTGLVGHMQPSPLKKPMQVIPSNSLACGSEWGSQDDAGGRQNFISTDHAPLSPQSSIASSGSEQTEEQGSARNTFLEDGSGMKDVPAWLKSLRLHKYASLFSQMTYEEMMILTEQHLESQNVTKGARHKIALSIQKLRERQSILKSLEKDILEGGNLRNALQELQQIIITPIKAYSPPSAAQPISDTSTNSTDGTKTGADKEATSEDLQSHNPPPCDGDSSVTPISDGDIAGQFTRVMGKVCTQLLVSRPDEENISCYLQLIEKCLAHEAFSETHKKRLVTWKQQVLKLLRLFPRKAMPDMSAYRQKGWNYGSNSLPTAGSVSGGVSRRGQRQFPMTPRGLPAGRMCLPGGIGGASPRHTLANPALAGQGRQNLWFANPGGSNSMPSQSRSSVQRTHSLPVHTSPQTMLMFQQQECQVPGSDLEINPTLESLCLSMTEHALGDGTDRTSTI
ncbi:protein Smaug homolog 2 [Xiphophorus maculatus]|uniref:Sterile alpha motif domain containing 4B n=1 Tax=Xiphophorus maculatus TaxID=8083 RepID=A0A3B5RCC2_XIPMA|nr:protein Smaug homolog 2 [Xiphophorus maculatus]XP_023207640.1 protein Smaug homolog 2 [Xiphophorus maculatus]XP_032446578.1 protein Smaug homolog 2 [Xiphophorus hellerii]XP_032446579.1 protein Smaug homolog 2 [Xiphophorus hellerii]